MKRPWMWNGFLGDTLMNQVIHGKVHGTTIELYQPLGIPDGQEVELTLQTVPTVVESQQWGDGLRRCAGALADIPGLDQDMEQILADRKAARFREVPE
jgi:hypothetical protein